MTDPLQESFEQYLRHSLARPGASRFAQVAGIRMHYLEWPGPPGAPPVLLLHGFLAHAHWWDFIAPWLAEHHRVIAPDFGGMGDSEHRREYRQELFHEEIAGIIEATGIAGCTAIGHSFGGRALLHACARHPRLVSHAIVVDSAALDHMGRCSIREEQGHWVWKFDEHITRLFQEGNRTGGIDDHQALRSLDVPVDFVYGEDSKVVTPSRARALRTALRNVKSVTGLPCSHHHLPVSAPLALLGTLRVLLQRAG